MRLCFFYHIIVDEYLKTKLLYILLDLFLRIFFRIPAKRQTYTPLEFNLRNVKPVTAP